MPDKAEKTLQLNWYLYVADAAFYIAERWKNS